MDAQKTLFECDFCDKCFSDEETLSNHVLSLHKSIIEGQKCPAEDKLRCNLCEKLFPSKNTLDIHVEREHKTLKTFQCEICNKQFGNKRILKTHLS